MENALESKWHRDELQKAVMFRIEHEIEKVIACLRTPTPQIAAALLREILPHSNFKLNSLSLDELRDEQAIAGLKAAAKIRESENRGAVAVAGDAVPYRAGAERFCAILCVLAGHSGGGVPCFGFDVCHQGQLPL